MKRKRKKTPYGKELILDLHQCDATQFSRKAIRSYFVQLCELIKMNRSKLCWWDDYRVPKAERQTLPHLKGTSAVQFIMTSNITIHTLDILQSVYLNIFSCKNFDARKAANFSKKYFRGKIVNQAVFDRR